MKMMTKIGVFLSARRFDEISGGWRGNANVKLLRTLRQRCVIPRAAEITEGGMRWGGAKAKRQCLKRNRSEGEKNGADSMGALPLGNDRGR